MRTTNATAILNRSATIRTLHRFVIFSITWHRTSIHFLVRFEIAHRVESLVKVLWIVKWTGLHWRIWSDSHISISIGQSFGIANLDSAPLQAFQLLLNLLLFSGLLVSRLSPLGSMWEPFFLDRSHAGLVTGRQSRLSVSSGGVYELVTMFQMTLQFTLHGMLMSA